MAKRSFFPKWCDTSRYKKTISIREGLGGLLRHMNSGDADSNFMLHQLWMSWDMVMGENLSGIACPLGHRENTLIIGGEDTIVLNDLMYWKDEILDRANAFMNGIMKFSKIEFSLAQGRTPLTKIPSLYRNLPFYSDLPTPEGLEGKASIPIDTSLGRFYLACLKRYGKLPPSY